MFFKSCDRRRCPDRREISGHNRAKRIFWYLTHKKKLKYLSDLLFKISSFLPVLFLFCFFLSFLWGQNNYIYLKIDDFMPWIECSEAQCFQPFRLSSCLSVYLCFFQTNLALSVTFDTLDIPYPLVKKFQAILAQISFCLWPLYCEPRWSPPPELCSFTNISCSSSFSVVVFVSTAKTECILESLGSSSQYN